ncbi:MAG: fumarate hydratase, partial [Candidatus Omnitrophota bacterium]
NPTAGEDTIVDFCVEVVQKAGPDACPPYVLGVGIGGTAEVCGLLAKKALTRPIDSRNPQEHIARLEDEIEKKVKELEIGVMGLGGISTVMGVNIEIAPTHIAGLPVAVNLSCHALRSARTVI